MVLISGIHVTRHVFFGFESSIFRARPLTLTLASLSPRENLEPALVNVSREEWDGFLSDHSKLMQKYELLLSHLDLARTRIQGLHEKTEQQMAKSSETLRQVRSALDRLCDDTERQLDESE